MFHLGWFLNYMPPAWRGNWGGRDGQDWTSGDFYIELAQACERAKFDYVMIEDSNMVPDAFGGNFNVELKHANYAPKLDPIPLLSAMAKATDRLGLVATMSTSLYPPYLLARLMSTIDHMSNGRSGWNIVTSSEHRAAQNYGLDKLFEHDERYERADEFVDVVKKLWASWEPDAVVLDRASGTYADGEKVRAIDHEGKYFKSRGPLNTLSSPQRRPVFCQAGASPRGMDFAAEHGETVITIVLGGIPAMRDYRNAIRERLERIGRDPDSCKVLFVVTPYVGDTREEAQSLYDRTHAATDWRAEEALAHLSAFTEIDFSKFDLDERIPDGLTTNGHQSALNNFVKRGDGGKTLREAAASWTVSCLDLIGTPDQVADQMGDAMDQIGGDGFLINGPLSRVYVSQITDGLVPALQRKGLTRTEYDYPTFRENLMAF